MQQLNQYFVNLMRSYRKKNGLSQETMASMIGVSQSQYSKYERSEQFMDLIKWGEFFELIEMDWKDFLEVKDHVRTERTRAEDYGYGTYHVNQYD